ncbi:hypothetical protein D3C83_284370 [compost metagenome]
MGLSEARIELDRALEDLHRLVAGLGGILPLDALPRSEEQVVRFDTARRPAGEELGFAR